MKLSIIVPVYNEVNTIEKIVNKIIDLKGLDTQIIIIDDNSSDGTTDILKNKIFNLVDLIIYHSQNLGKGAAIKSAQKHVSGDIVIIQDADLEYDPKDYYALLQPFKKKISDVVYGSRTLGKKRYSYSSGFISFLRIFSNHMLTLFSNLLNQQNLTDAHTCYKVFKSEVFKDINLQEKDFAFCPEITSKISKIGLKIVEVPISYQGRKVSEGKKISIFDGFRALYVLIKYKFFY